MQKKYWGLYEPTHEILALFVLRKFILQIRMRSHPVRLDVWFLAWLFICFHSSWVQTAKALARLRGCAGSPESWLVAYVTSTIISSVGSYSNHMHIFRPWQKFQKDWHKTVGGVVHTKYLLSIHFGSFWAWKTTKFKMQKKW